MTVAPRVVLGTLRVPIVGLKYSGRWNGSQEAIVAFCKNIPPEFKRYGALELRWWSSYNGTRTKPHSFELC